jgi:cell division protein FtsB
MRDRLRSLFTSPRWRGRLIVALLAGLALWVAFLDSHSLLKRAQYAQERKTLRAEVETLREANETFEARLASGLTDEIVETVAREQYGMRRPGETVYPVEVVDQ